MGWGGPGDEADDVAESAPSTTSGAAYRAPKPQTLFAGRILPFDENAALIRAQLMADGKAAGRSRSSLDMIIASIAQANGCILATDNDRDFIGLGAVDPLRWRRCRATARPRFITSFRGGGKA